LRDAFQALTELEIEMESRLDNDCHDMVSEEIEECQRWYQRVRELRRSVHPLKEK
jgi:hypothetical protein